VERGLSIRQVAAGAGVHHTYVSKLERGDRQAPEEAVVEALAAALDASPSQLDQLRWRAGLAPRTVGETGVPGQDDATLTLVAEALASAALPEAQRDRLRQVIAEAVQGTHRRGDAETLRYAQGQARGHGEPSLRSGVGLESSVPQRKADETLGAAFPGVGQPVPPDRSLSASPRPPVPVSVAPEAPPDPRATMLAGLLSGWQTLDEAAAELRVTTAYLWELVQGGHLRAWALPGAAPETAVGVRVRREDVLALLQPVMPAGRQVR
jgi:transcriptional regulator with XRE-family HTH domain